ncbi:MAG: tetratricopeptide repeat protein [Negativicutes bacterium]
MKNFKYLVFSLMIMTTFYCSQYCPNYAIAASSEASFSNVVTTEGTYALIECETPSVAKDRANFIALSNAYTLFAKSLKNYPPIVQKNLTDNQALILAEALTTSATIAHSTKNIDNTNYYYVKSLNTIDLINLSNTLAIVLDSQISSLVSSVNSAFDKNSAENNELLTKYTNSKNKLEQQSIKNKIAANEAEFEALNYTLQSFIAYANGDYDNGKSTASKAINFVKNFASSYFIRGLNLMAAKDPTGAIIDFTLAIENNPKFYDAYYDRATLYIDISDTEKAIADLTVCIDLRPNSVDPYILRGTLYAKKHRNDLALADFNQALVLDDKNAPAYLKRANIYYDKGNFDLALTDFQKAADLGINDAPVFLIIGNLSYEQKKYSDAIIAYNKYLAITRRDTNVYMKLGNCYDQLQQYETAIVEYSNALQFDKTAQMYFSRANDYYLVAAGNKEQYDLAISDCSSVIALDSGNVDAYILRGRSYKAIQNLDSAIADFSKAVELNPANSKLAAAFNYRAWCYAAKGGNSNNIHATQDFLKAQIVDPTNPDYDYSLAQFYDGINFAKPDTINAYKSFIKKAAAKPDYKEKIDAATKRILELGGKI